MRTLIFSDTHIKNDKYGLRDLKLKVLDKIIGVEYYQCCVIAGDLFDKRTYDVALATKVSEIIMRHSKDELLDRTFWQLTGNHDTFKGEYSTLSPYAVGNEALKVVGEKEIFFNNLMLQGWTNGKMPESPGEDAVYIGHINLKDYIGKGYTLAELEAMGYKRIITGDLHEHFTTGKVTSIGCFPSSFSDEGYQASYLIYDDATDTLERKIIGDFPKFVTLTYDGEWQSDLSEVAGNIVRLKADYGCDKVSLEAAIMELKPFRFAGTVLIKKENSQKKIENVVLKPKELMKNEAQRNNWSDSQLSIIMEHLN